MNMVRYFVKKSFNEEIQEVSHINGEHTWVYGSEVSEADISKIADECSLDLNILRDVRDVHELPRVEYSKGVAYIFVRIPRAIKNGGFRFAPLLFVVRGDLLVTLSSVKYFTPEELASLYRFSMRSSTSVFLQALSHIYSLYGREIQQASAQIRNTQQRLQTRSINNKDLMKFVSLEGLLVEYQTNLLASRTLFERILENKHDLLTEKECEFLDDILLYVNQLSVAVKSGSQTLDSIRSTFSTMNDNALNQRMKTLTLLTMFLTVPNVIFGMFGMNVLLPVNTTDPWSFMAIIGGSIMLIVLAYLMVRKYKF